MKKINNIFKIMVLFGVISFTSCETTELDITENPNALNPTQASPDFFLNGAQVNFASFVESFGYAGGQLTRMDQMSGRQYLNAYGPSSFDGRWRTAYSTLMQDIKLMNDVAIEKNLSNHVAMGQVMQAHVLFTLVDFFGDVPYTEAISSETTLNPSADSGADIYAAAIALLDSAIAGFDASKTAPQYDFFYDGDWDKWIKAANTLKMKAYMATRLVDGAALGKFNAIVATGNYISTTADDFQFTWGNNEIQPDTRHPRYRSSYTSTGGGSYRSNSLMAYMTGKDAGAYSSPLNFDIRTLYYFYRQVSGTPGFGAPADEEVLECGLIVPPAHYAGYVYCGVPKGWWGRDHGNDNGIPPDGFKRTLTGIYPAGGVLDDLSYDAQNNGKGQGGKGITPVMLASWTKFMIAETQMLANNPTGAKTTMFEGIDMSIAKVTSFGPSTDRFDWIFGTASGGPAIAHQNDYIAWFKGDLGGDWDTGNMTAKWDILANQYFVASYGNGIDAYNFYRRTGYPTTLQPNIEPTPGNFPKSMWYPAAYANTNSNATQKSNLDVQVFWDNNPVTGFPSAN
jgi:hypothetical protein